MKKKSFRMKKIHIKVLTILSAVLITAMTATLPVSAKTTKIFKPVSEENAERNSAESEQSTAQTETKESNQKEDTPTDQEDKQTTKIQKSTKRQRTLKKSGEATVKDEKTPGPEETENVPDKETTETELQAQEPVYDVLTDIRCILLGLLMVAGLITGIVLSHSFQRGIKK